MNISLSPIVAVLGHVDHGKTSLLDAIRKTNVASREAGSITQHIGAYLITHNSQPITFIDTPGHAAFSQMRSRGANVADIVLLIVAADDGVKPQTRESLQFIRAAQVPFIVVLTKVDLPTAQPERVKQELEKEGILLEGRGGDIVVTEVSSKTGQGISHLLEMISLVSEIHEIKGDSEAVLEATVIESQFDSRKGALATVIVRNGQLNLGDKITAGEVVGKVKALIGDQGQNLESVLPGQAGQILGLEKVPTVGSQVKLAGEGGVVKVESANVKQQEVKEGLPAGADKPAQAGAKLSLIIKADTAGRLEALMAGLSSEVVVLSSGTGEVTAGDVALASSFGATIIAFGVKVPPEVLQQAEEDKVKIFSFAIIYEIFDWIAKALAGEVAEEVKILGRAEIIAQFPFGANQKIAGIRVAEGRIARGDNLTLSRKGEVIGKVKISSMKQADKTVDKVEKGQECGLIFAGTVDFQIGDVLESVR